MLIQATASGEPRRLLFLTALLAASVTPAAMMLLSVVLNLICRLSAALTSVLNVACVRRRPHAHSGRAAAPRVHAARLSPARLVSQIVRLSTLHD
jgi:hypothetical protein